MNIIIGADLVPTDSNVEIFKKGDAKALVGEDLLHTISNASYRIFNLEVPLTDTKNPIIKQGPNLIAPTATVNGYKALGVNLLTLANNHILDQGKQGLKETIEVLDKNGIAHVGAGKDQFEAEKPYVFSFADKKIGVYACAEHEFSISSNNIPGANPFDPLWSLDHVEELKKTVDFVIVLYHGGKEHYRYPSPNLQIVCRRLVDKGADLVICQHSHCIGCEEKYKSGTILYGQGNFLFDDNDNEFWQTSLLVCVDDSFNISYVPLRKRGNSVRLAEDGEKILEGLQDRSKEIKIEGFVEENYGKFADEFLPKYLLKYSGKENILFRAINKLSGGRLRRKKLNRLYDMKQKVALINYTECEAHRELLLKGLKRGST